MDTNPLLYLGVYAIAWVYNTSAIVAGVYVALVLHDRRHKRCQK